MGRKKRERRVRRAAKAKPRAGAPKRRRPISRPKRRRAAKSKAGRAAPSRGRPQPKSKRWPVPKPPKRPAGQPRPRAAAKAVRARARVSVFIGASVDGFIARQNGDLDWLEVKGDAKGEDYGYKAFVGEIDAVVMGRKTFEKVLTFKGWPFGKTPVFVLTTRPLPIPPKLRGSVETMADRPSEVVKRLAKVGLRRLYVDGGYTVQGFLRAGLVDQLTIARIPVLLGQGVPLFGALPSDVQLRHVETRPFRSGLVQTTYAVSRRGRTEGAEGTKPTLQTIVMKAKAAEPVRAGAQGKQPGPTLESAAPQPQGGPAPDSAVPLAGAVPQSSDHASNEEE